MSYVLFIASVIAYAFVVGVTFALVGAETNDQTETNSWFVASLFWPITLPVLLAYKTTRWLVALADQRRERIERQAEELKQRIADLDEELEEEARRKEAADERRAEARRAVQ